MEKLYSLWILGNYGDDEQYFEAATNVTFADALSRAVQIIITDDTLQLDCMAHIFRPFDDFDVEEFVTAVEEMTGNEGFVDYMLRIDKETGEIDATYDYLFGKGMSVDDIVAVHNEDPLEFLQFVSEPRQIMIDRLAAK